MAAEVIELAPATPSQPAPTGRRPSFRSQSQVPPVPQQHLDTSLSSHQTRSESQPSAELSFGDSYFEDLVAPAPAPVPEPPSPPKQVYRPPQPPSSPPEAGDLSTVPETQAPPTTSPAVQKEKEEKEKEGKEDVTDTTINGSFGETRVATSPPPPAHNPDDPSPIEDETDELEETPASPSPASSGLIQDALLRKSPFKPSPIRPLKGFQSTPALMSSPDELSKSALFGPFEKNSGDAEDEGSADSPVASGSGPKYLTSHHTAPSPSKSKVVFPTSDAFRRVAPQPKKTLKDPFDYTDESMSMEMSESSPPKPTAERTIDMEIDDEEEEGDSTQLEGGEGDTTQIEGGETTQIEMEPTQLDDSVQTQKNETQESSLKTNPTQPPPQQPLPRPFFVSETPSQSQSLSQSQSMPIPTALSSQDQDGRRRLMDISELRSSGVEGIEPPSPIELEPTQLYDVERYHNADSMESSIPLSRVGEEETTDRDLPKFLYETSDIDSLSRHNSRPNSRSTQPPPQPAPDPVPEVESPESSQAVLLISLFVDKEKEAEHSAGESTRIVESTPVTGSGEAEPQVGPSIIEEGMEKEMERDEPEMEVDVPTNDFYGGGPEEEEEEVPELDEPPVGKGKGKGKAKATAKAKSKAKAKAKPVAKAKVAIARTRAKGKGKATVDDSPDPLAMGAGNTFQETNYEDPPDTRNSKIGRSSIAVPSSSPSNVNVAGPSKKRRESNVSVEVDNSRKRPRKSDDASNKSMTTKASKALPPTAPFKRVFAMWRDDKWFYPGTILSRQSNGMFHVRFDDDSVGMLKPNEIRRCVLKKGDKVRFRGDDPSSRLEEADAEVVVVEKQGGEEELEEGTLLEKLDVAVVRIDEDQETASQNSDRIKVEALCVHPRYTSQFFDRILTTDELAGFEGKEAVALPKLSLLPVLSSTRPKPIYPSAITGIFSGQAFIVTRAPATVAAASTASGKGTKRGRVVKEDVDREKASQIEMLEKNGAVVIAVDQVFEVEDVQGAIKLHVQGVEAKVIDEVLLLTDRPVTTPKYLVALALGIPCISQEYVTRSIAENVRCNWRKYLVASGFLTSFGASVSSGSMKALMKDKLDFRSIAEGVSNGILSGHSILVVMSLPKTGKVTAEQATQIATYRSIISAAGAERCDFVRNTKAAANGEGYHYAVILDDTLELDAPLRNHPGIVNLEWVKQSLIAGWRVDPGRLEASKVGLE